MSTVAITNPSDNKALAGIVEELGDVWSPKTLLEKFGDKLEDGALVSVFDVSVFQYVATRVGDSIALRTNDGWADLGDELLIDKCSPDYGPVESLMAPLASEEPEPELEEYTVVGTNDDSDPFTATVTASSPEQAEEEGIKAGLVDEGYEYLVTIIAVFKGDLSGINVTPEAD